MNDESNWYPNFRSDYNLSYQNSGRSQKPTEDRRHTLYEYPNDKLDNLMSILAQYVSLHLSLSQ